MAQIFVNARARILKNTVIHVRRKIPSGKGKILVSEGQEVFPETVISEGHIFAGFRTIHLADELEISPKYASKYLKYKEGQNVYEGEILAQRNSLFGVIKKTVFVPDDGIVDLYDEKRGSLKLRIFPKTTKVVSGVHGLVDKIDTQANLVLIKSLVNVVFGIFGSGRNREGLLKILHSPEILVSSKQITPDLSSKIVVGGGMVFLDALQKLVALGAAGFVSGGVSAKDYRAMVGGNWNLYQKQWSDVGLTMLVTEGFGSAQIGQDIYSLLQVYDNKFVIIDGNRTMLILPINNQDSMMYIRRVSLPITSSIAFGPYLEVVDLKVGMRVRILMSPYLGIQGEVVGIDEAMSKLPSGIVAILVTVDTGRSKLRIPRDNLEAIGV